MKNLTDIMKQVQSMQSRMGEIQDKLGAMSVSGQAGNGLVQVTMTGKANVTAVRIDPSLMKPEEIEILEDLLLLALNDGKAKAEALAADEVKAVTGGLPLPGGFKLPF